MFRVLTRIFFYTILIVFISTFTKAHSSAFYIKPKAYLNVESGQMIYGKVLGIEDEKIISISDAAPLRKKIINIESLYLIPGLIDCHAHIFFTQVKEDVTFENALLRESKLTDEFRTKRAKEFLRDYLNEGFTSVCDLGNSGQFLDVQLKKTILKNSSYPDFFVSGPGIATNKAQFYPNTADTLVRKEYTIVDEKTDLENVLKEYQERNVDILKIYADNSPGVGGMDEAMLDKIYKSQKREFFKKITFHAIEKAAIEKLSKLKVVSVEHASEGTWDVDQENTYLTLTDLPSSILKEFNYYKKVFYEYQLFRAQKAYQKKIKLVFGPDFYFHSNEKGFNRAQYVKRSIEAWQEAKIPSLEIIKALTVNPANSLRLNGKQGVIKVGAKANIIGLSDDPSIKIETINNPFFIMNKGVIIKNSELNSSKPDKKR